jgi:hypothetical protein
MKMMIKNPRIMNYRYIPLTLLFLVLTEILSGQPFSEKRTFRKSVRVNREMTLEVRNKYGTVHITPSGSDSVRITAEIDASASSREKISKMLDGINVNLTSTDFAVIAQTEFNQSINTLFEDFKGMTNKIFQYDSKVQINYFISAPEYLNLKIDNKYGDVYLENCTGNASLTVSNGSLKANSLRNAHDLNLSFCDATISNAGDAIIDASFSEVTIGESATLKINSVSSKFELKAAGQISTESKRDKFFIGTIKSLHGESYFTDFRIDKLSGDVDLTTKYGSLNIDMVEKGFRGANINSGYSEVYITFDPSASYNLEIRHTNTTLTLPEANAKIDKKTVNEEDREFISFGTVGKNPDKINVNIEATRGKIWIR